MTVRVSEIYPSVQGEGPKTGNTTIFLRFGGCNLRCPGWPCDTQFAIQPEFREEWRRLAPEQVYLEATIAAMKVGAKMITLTGGEPFLQPKADLMQLVDGFLMHDLEVEAFTNGTIDYPQWAVQSVRMIMDWKLPGSGEDPYNKVRFANISRLIENNIYGGMKHAVKFVCKDEADFDKAVELYQDFLVKHKEFIDVYYGRVWDGEITNADLVKNVMELQLPWKLNVQVHNMIWDPQERGR